MKIFITILYQKFKYLDRQESYLNPKQYLPTFLFIVYLLQYGYHPLTLEVRFIENLHQL